MRYSDGRGFAPRLLDQAVPRGAGDSKTAGIRWAEVVPGSVEYRVALHVRRDVGSEQFCDLVEFPPLEDSAEEGFGEQVTVGAEARGALTASHDAVGAAIDRWVNQGMGVTNTWTTGGRGDRRRRGRRARESGRVRAGDDATQSLVFDVAVTPGDVPTDPAALLLAARWPIPSRAKRRSVVNWASIRFSHELLVGE